MILPIVAYGHHNLRKTSVDIKKEDVSDFDEFMKNLWMTMYETDGVGLAAPQVNRNIRIFVIDADPFKDKYPEAKGLKKAFINAHIIERGGEDVYRNEGCLSLPGIHEDIKRPSKIRIKYLDENFQEHEEDMDGVLAWVVQHEYDHLEGILFVDHLPSMRKMLLRTKLNDIAKANIRSPYRMIFADKKNIKL